MPIRPKKVMCSVGKFLENANRVSLLSVPQDVRSSFIPDVGASASSLLPVFHVEREISSNECSFGQQ